MFPWGEKPKAVVTQMKLCGLDRGGEINKDFLEEATMELELGVKGNHPGDSEVLLTGECRRIAKYAR